MHDLNLIYTIAGGLSAAFIGGYITERPGAVVERRLSPRGALAASP